MYKVGIIEDEYFAQRVLINLLDQYKKQLQIVHISNNVEDAKIDILKYKPDFVFLDIELPGGNGFNVIKTLEAINSKIIFTTAYEKFAVKAFEASAVDYLLKPIFPDRLENALEKVMHQIKLDKLTINYEGLKTNLDAKKVTTLTLKYKDSFRIVPANDILYFKAEGAYTLVKTKKSQYLQTHKLNHYEGIFQDDSSIIRTHRSWMINTNHIAAFSKSDRTVTILSEKIPISKTRMRLFIESIEQKNSV